MTSLRHRWRLLAIVVAAAVCALPSTASAIDDDPDGPQDQDELHRVTIVVDKVKITKDGDAVGCGEVRVSVYPMNLSRKQVRQPTENSSCTGATHSVSPAVGVFTKD